MPRTIGDVLRAGQVMRWWCFRCATGADLSRADLAEYWFLELAEIAIFCPQCSRADEVTALPAAGPPEPPQPAEDDRPLTSSDVVSFIFHASRSAAKKRARDRRR